MESDLRKKLYKIREEINYELTDSESGKVKKELVEPVVCPICDANEYTHKKTKEGFDFVQCNSCDFVYVNPRLKQGVSDRFYVSSDLMSTLVQLQQIEADVEAEKKYIPILERLSSYKDKGCTMLDVGCSIGNFMSLAAEQGWDVTGIELNKKAYQVCLNRGLSVYNEKLETLKLDHKYDVVSLFALIEHLHHPNMMLQEVSKVLKDEGILLLFFPEWDGNWNHPQVNGRAHLWYFNEKSITSLLKNNGFKIEDTWLIDWLKGPKRVVVASK